MQIKYFLSIVSKEKPIVNMIFEIEENDVLAASRVLNKGFIESLYPDFNIETDTANLYKMNWIDGI